MREFLRELTRGQKHTPEPTIPGAPFSRHELPDLLGEHPPLAEFVRGASDYVGPEMGTAALVEAALWLTVIGDNQRASAAFRAAASKELSQAQLGTDAGVAYARREPLPVKSGAEGGAFLALGRDTEAAADVWQQTLHWYGPIAGADEVDQAAAAQRAWQPWEARLYEIDHVEPAPERAPEDEPLDPSKLGYMSIYLAYAALRTGARDVASRYLAREAALRAAIPTQQSRSYYGELLQFPGMLANILRAIVTRLGDPTQRPPDKPAQTYVATRLPGALALTLDLQRAFPELMPVVVPPADITHMLGKRALNRLNERRGRR